MKKELTLLKILKPSNQEKAYDSAAVEFQDFYKKVTGKKLEIINTPDENSDLIVIGSDAVNPFCHEMIFKNVIGGFKIKYATDDYHILSAKDGKRKLLFLAGGRGRATIYAVYDFFERQAGCRYFWDGDIVPKKKNISIEKLDIAQSPRFQYRGIRYFAHRSLHRFQAEHWDFEDWKKEIDWIMKKRLNLFMLRIGQDDLFQKAFPEIVQYPPATGILPEATPRSYDDRTLFWSLEYRGELRKKILRYAFDRDLLHPEDFGTMTHWYSRTPNDFLEKEKPDFMPQTTSTYSQKTGLVWDIRKERNLDNYFKLTETHIKEYGRPEIFHTIGLAERKCFETRRENLELKLFTYRTLIRKLRERYPNAPVLIAGWDMLMYWEKEEVQKFVAELDPGNTLFFDYTSDNGDKENNFTRWGLVGKFPWIFGLFHAFEPNTDIRGDYRCIERRLKIAAHDQFCKGMVFWPETSHSDTFMLEYFTLNAWIPLKFSLDEQIVKFCLDRYGVSNKKMLVVWRGFMPIVQLSAFLWSRRKPWLGLFSEPFFRLISTSYLCTLDKAAVRTLKHFDKLFSPVVRNAPALLAKLSEIKFSKEDKFICRDILDIAKTTAARTLFYGFTKLNLKMEDWRKSKAIEKEVMALGRDCLEMIEKLGDLLGTHPDYSLNVSLKRLVGKTSVNPAFEQALKGNAENLYCRTFIYELFQGLYIKEAKVYLQWLSEKMASGDRSEWKRPEYFDIEQKKIQDEFYGTPLKLMAPPYISKKENNIQETLTSMSQTARNIIFA
ncbi:MAG: alpha-N-acetylglucosaminidase TIM-barrel domain-containing protein [Phycisphaerae bacterium]